MYFIFIATLLPFLKLFPFHIKSCGISKQFVSTVHSFDASTKIVMLKPLFIYSTFDTLIYWYIYIYIFTLPIITHLMIWIVKIIYELSNLISKIVSVFVSSLYVYVAYNPSVCACMYFFVCMPDFSLCICVEAENKEGQYKLPLE